MQPRTKIEKEVAALSAKLRPLTAAAMADAAKKCTPHEAYICKGYAWCSDCGYVFEYKTEGELSVVMTNDERIICPHCGARLDKKVSRKEKVICMYWYGVVQTIGGWTVVRHFLVDYSIWKREEPYRNVTECVQNWIDDNGKEVVMARNTKMNCYYNDLFDYRTPITIKRKQRDYYSNSYYGYDHRYRICDYATYGRTSITPKVKQHGFNGVPKGVPADEYIVALLCDPNVEQLRKMNQTSVMLAAMSHPIHQQEMQAVKICNRHKYLIRDAGLWLDMLHALQQLGKDIHNPKFICPDNLQESHDYWIAKNNKRKAAEAYARKLKDARESEEAYRNKKGNYLGIRFDADGIHVKPLQTVSEFAEEGEAMHHCVFSNAYYEKETSLILGVRDNEGHRLATVELSLRDKRILQCRAKCNQVPERDQEIRDLIMANVGKIEKAEREASKLRCAALEDAG